MSIGEKLRQAREARAITLHQIAEHTNISVRFLDALEKGQTDKLPGGIFTRGFVRSYAAQVGLDPDDTVRQYVAAHPEVRIDGEADDTEPRRSVVPILVTVLLVLALGIGGGWYLWSSVKRPATVATTQPSGAALPTNRPPASSVVPPPAATAVPSTGETMASAPATSGAPASQPTTGGSGAVDAAEPSVARGLALRLTLVPTGRCWVQVRADGRVRLAREVVAGERVDIEAAEVIEIVAGDAGAFAYRLNGEPGRALGAAGRIGRAKITPANVADYQNATS